MDFGHLVCFPIGVDYPSGKPGGTLRCILPARVPHFPGHAPKADVSLYEPARTPPALGTEPRNHNNSPAT